MNKMLVFDLDGTLLGENRWITRETKEYLKLKKEEGYKIVIATGRIFASAIEVTDGAEFSDYIISDTGAAIYKTDSQDGFFVNSISTEIVEKIFDYHNDKFRFIDVCNKNNIYKYSDEIDENKIVINLKDKDEILNRIGEITHVSISMYENIDVERLFDILCDDFPELSIMIMQDSFDGRKWIEIQPKDCSKYNSISILAKHLNIKNEDIIAFGDGLNDIEMVEKCGIGIAMNNAFDEVKNVAKYVTKKSHVDNGVIEFLKEYLD